MSEFLQREVSGFRFVETRQDDTLQSVALRELGDAARWAELVSFNGLTPPFIVTDAALLKPGVILAGQLLKVPAPTRAAATIDPDLVFERDVALNTDGSLNTDGTDFGVVAGSANLRQALANRLQTDQGELAFHPRYGSLLRRIVGTTNGPTSKLLAAAYAKAAVRQDPRVSRVVSSTASVSGDRVTVQVSAEPIVGRAVDVTESL